MEPDTLWSAGLTAGLAFIGWGLRTWLGELSRLNILLNKTREEIAKEYVTKQEVHADINRVMHRLEALDSKLDRLIENQKWDGYTERRTTPRDMA
jgi:hypothetical protein